MNFVQQFLKDNFRINTQLLNLFEEVENDISSQLKSIDETTQINQYKVISAMQQNKLSDIHFVGTTGYGYDDLGREVIDKIYSDIFGAQDALVRHNFISGTHALSTALYGMLRPGDTLLAVTGKPYDTLDQVIGIRGEDEGSLKDFGIKYGQVDLLDNGDIDFDTLKVKIDNTTKVALIQRSKGYAWRNSFSIADIKKIVDFIKSINKDVICMVDNCYGEFVETSEPTIVGADICVGSLIKNPGGGITHTGGYIVGRTDLVEKISYRLTTPGIGKECGASLGFNRNMLQGLFLAPHVVGESIKGATFASRFFEKLGFEVLPKMEQYRTDIIQAIKFNDAEKLIAFCQGIQKASPVDAHVLPYPWEMPGYENQVIMAAGTFVQGASIELSADAPLKSPYIGYMQGGLTFDHVKLGVVVAAQEMISAGLLKI